MRALISWELYFLPSISVLHVVPMWRLTDRIVRSGLVMAWRLATSPTSTSPFFAKATTDGVVREPSALGMTTGSPAWKTQTTELVVPRSIPTAFTMDCSLLAEVHDAEGHARRKNVHAELGARVSIYAPASTQTYWLPSSQT